jgi:hypothetical protein
MASHDWDAGPPGGVRTHPKCSFDDQGRPVYPKGASEAGALRLIRQPVSVSVSAEEHFGPQLPDNFRPA